LHQAHPPESFDSKTWEIKPQRDVTDFKRGCADSDGFCGFQKMPEGVVYSIGSLLFRVGSWKLKYPNQGSMMMKSSAICHISALNEFLKQTGIIILPSLFTSSERFDAILIPTYNHSNIEIILESGSGDPVVSITSTPFSINFLAIILSGMCPAFASQRAAISISAPNRMVIAVVSLIFSPQCVVKCLY